MQMKIYIVFRHDYEEETILGVYTDIDMAKKVQEINKDNYTIKEYELNQLTKEGLYEITGYISNLKQTLGLKGDE